MGGSTALAAITLAALGAIAGPIMAGWVLTAPDAASRAWWRPDPAGRPDTALIGQCAGAGALAGALCGVAAGWGAALPAFAALALLLAPLAIIDARTHRLPDRLTGAAAVAVMGLLVLAAAGHPGLADAGRALLGGAAAFAVLCALRLAAPSGLGFGDAKLGGVLGLVLGWLGWGVLIAGLFAGFAVGAAASLTLLALRRATLRSAIPFGPSLITGALVVAAWANGA
ncbi:MAG: peptidase prepilin type [Jatrophihabitantaceae bacterium]|nr:peptidase prepilin type [Jatrophihabitantaceae bacterium]